MSPLGGQASSDLPMTDSPPCRYKCWINSRQPEVLRVPIPIYALFFLSQTGVSACLIKIPGTTQGPFWALCFLVLCLQKAMTGSSMLGAAWARGIETNSLLPTMPCPPADCLPKGASKNRPGRWCPETAVILVDVPCALKRGTLPEGEPHHSTRHRRGRTYGKHFIYNEMVLLNMCVSYIYIVSPHYSRILYFQTGLLAKSSF